jgi:hypothetical protein
MLHLVFERALLIPLSLSRELDTLAGGGWVTASSRLRKNYVGTPERSTPVKGKT